MHISSLAKYVGLTVLVAETNFNLLNQYSDSSHLWKDSILIAKKEK